MAYLLLLVININSKQLLRWCTKAVNKKLVKYRPGLEVIIFLYKPKLKH